MTLCMRLESSINEEKLYYTIISSKKNNEQSFVQWYKKHMDLGILGQQDLFFL